MDKMKDIAIYGAGGLGREIVCMINRINNASDSGKWNFIGFFDDGIDKGAELYYGTVLGGKNELNHWDKELYIAIAVTSPKTRNNIVDNIRNEKIKYPNLIDPNCIFFDAKNFFIGEGNLLGSGCQFSCAARIGDFNIFNCFISVGHDTEIQDYNSFMPGTRISGEISIGRFNMFGANSFIHQQIKIGNNVVLAPCSVLLRKPQDGNTYFGIPATKMKM